MSGLQRGILIAIGAACGAIAVSTVVLQLAGTQMTDAAPERIGQHL